MLVSFAYELSRFFFFFTISPQSSHSVGESSLDYPSIKMIQKAFLVFKGTAKTYKVLKLHQPSRIKAFYLRDNTGMGKMELQEWGIFVC